MKNAIIKLLLFNCCLCASLITVCKGGGRRDIIEDQIVNRTTTENYSTDVIRKNIVKNKLSKKSNQKTIVAKK